MLRFFRCIRQKLFSEGKISKYMLYAIGEIALVMIGILLALQVNNWNEGRKSRERQTEYLVQIENEMTANRLALLEEKKKLSGILDGLRDFIRLKEKDLATLSEAEICNVWARVFSKSSNFRYESAVLSALVSTGNIKEIVNDTIRQTLASWESKVRKVKNQETEFNKYLERGNDFLLENGSFRQILDDCNISEKWNIDKLKKPYSNVLLLESQKFENIMTFGIATGATLETGFYADFEEEMDILLGQIEKELQ